MLKDPEYLLDSSFKPSHEPVYIGPYIVVRRLPHGTYLVKDETGEQLKRSVPLDQMKLVPSAADSAATDNRDVYVVDNIVAHRITPLGVLEYRVKWKGYSTKQNSWIPEENLVDTDYVHQYFKTGRYARLSTAVNAVSIPDQVSLRFDW
jgi:hypothetical protein